MFSSSVWVVIPDFQPACSGLWQVSWLLWFGWMMSQGPHSAMQWVLHLRASGPCSVCMTMCFDDILSQIAHKSFGALVPPSLVWETPARRSCLMLLCDPAVLTLHWAYMYVFPHSPRKKAILYARPWWEGGAGISFWLRPDSTFEELTSRGKCSAHSWKSFLIG